MTFKKNKIASYLTLIFATGSTYPIFAQDSDVADPNIEKIEVKGIRGSLQKASFQKQYADSIQDSIVAEDIGKFPDQNVAESLQRITGVSISRQNGEGSQITIRSFGPEFNAVKLNDRTTATVGGGRSFDFQVLPSELISGADVIKSPTADLSAGSIGAYVNVTTARPLDSPGFKATGSVKANYQDLSEDTNGQISAIVSNTFLDDSLGILLGVAYKESQNRIDNYRTSHWAQFGLNGTGYDLPGNWNYSPIDVVDESGQVSDRTAIRGPGRTIFNSNNEERDRLGVNFVLQYESSDNFVSTVDVMYSKLNRGELGGGLQIPNQEERYTYAMVNDSGTLLEANLANVDLEMNVLTSQQEMTTTLFGYNGVYTGDKFTLELDASYSKAESYFEGDGSTALHYTRFQSTQDVVNSYQDIRDENGNLLSNDIFIDYRNDIPDVTITGLDLLDPSKIRASWQRFSESKSEDEVREIKLNHKYLFDSDTFVSLQSGLAYTSRTTSSSVSATEMDPLTGSPDWGRGFMWIGGGATWPTTAETGKLDDSLYTLSPSNFMSGISGNFPRQWLMISDFNKYREATQKLLPPGSENWWTTYPSLADTYSNDETEIAAYLRLNMEGDIGDYTWSGNVGGRYVTVDNSTVGAATLIDLLYLDERQDVPEGLIYNRTDSTQELTEFKTDENYFLPSLNLSLNLGDGYYVKTAMAKTVTRPALADASGNVSEAGLGHVPVVEIRGGNPFLKAYKATQLDLSFEYYAENGDAYTATYFYKDITNFISTITKTGAWEGNISSDLSDAYADIGQTVSFVSTRKENRAGGTVQGLELGMLHNFDYLPTWFSGLGIQANYTYADSKDKDVELLNQPDIPEPGSGLEGFAKHSFNFIAFYDYESLQARLAYNWRDKFLLSRSGDGIQPEFNDSYGQLDASISYNLSENVSIGLEAINLTNETRLQYFGQRDRVSLVEMTGTRYQLGVRASF
ncbi:TonB-dependent receptor [Shewanella acanthi]|uniref:TonB-dependent receptor n=1 Tax=Shewanella acanthi TaxID=2864212 RepID=UPI001C657855|nr:TonB-dependent receptor [Shewanella acanthi]QYJ78344.1 TonB-dependent receptor [Shewanella acanthi]